MSGRAVRGTRAGHAFFILRPSDSRNLEELVENLKRPHLRPLGSALVPAISQQTRAKSRGENAAISASATMLVSLMARAGENGRTLSELESFVGKTLGGKLVVPLVARGARLAASIGATFGLRERRQRCGANEPWTGCGEVNAATRFCSRLRPTCAGFILTRG